MAVAVVAAVVAEGKVAVAMEEGTIINVLVPMNGKSLVLMDNELKSTHHIACQKEYGSTSQKILAINSYR